MDITIHLEDEVVRKLEYIQQQTNQDTEAVLNHTVVEAIDAYYQKIQSPNSDSLEQLQQSQFIGCFEGAPDLATNAEANFQAIIDKKYDHS